VVTLVQTLVATVAFALGFLALLALLCAVIGAVLLIGLCIAALGATLTLVGIVLYALLGGFDERPVVARSPLPAPT
jgi:hypothetical protein